MADSNLLRSAQDMRRAAEDKQKQARDMQRQIDDQRSKITSQISEIKSRTDHELREMTVHLQHEESEHDKRRNAMLAEMQAMRTNAENQIQQLNQQLNQDIDRFKQEAAQATNDSQNLQTQARDIENQA